MAGTGTPPKAIVYTLAGVFVALFAGVWLYMCWKLFTYDPKGGSATLEFSKNLIITAGFLATTVGAGTAAVLGITIADVSNDASTNNRTFGTAFKESDAKSGLITTTVLIYVGVGIVVLIAWLTKSKEAPDVFNTFAFAALGWIAGAFSSVFKPS